MAKEIDERIAAAWRSFWALKRFLLSDLPMSHKRKLLDSIILSVMTYGPQSWSLSKAQGKKLQAEQKAMERRILRISLMQHRTNELIRTITGIEDVLTRARELKWNFTGLEMRMDTNRLLLLILNWTPQDGSRKRGHQKLRWSDDIENVGLERWREKAQDRKLWNDLIEFFVQLD